MSSNPDHQLTLAPGQRVQIITASTGSRGQALHSQIGTILRHTADGYYQVRLDGDADLPQDMYFYGSQLAPFDATGQR